MSIRAFWRRLRGYDQPEGELTIDLPNWDALDLGAALIELSDEQLAAMGWSRDERNAAFDAINAHATARYARDKSVDPDNRPHPITMSRQNWKMVFAVAQALRQHGVEGWPRRVAMKIAVSAVTSQGQLR